MASEASRQSSDAPGKTETGATPPPEQRSIESLLRSLMQRVEDSERRYNEALAELHARLDQLSEKTPAEYPLGSPAEAEAYGRLRDQVSELARRLEQSEETAPTFDEFAELGRALAASAGPSDQNQSEDLEAQSEQAPLAGTPGAAEPSDRLSSALDIENEDFDKRLVEIAHRLESSLDMAMPANALDAMAARMDDITHRLEEALAQAAKIENLEHIERQLGELRQQIGRAEHQIAKISSVEQHLLRLIERFEAPVEAETQAPLDAGQIEDVATKAAQRAFELFAKSEKESGRPDRLDAIHRDLNAISERSRAADDRLTDSLSAVQESLQALALQIEQATQPEPEPVPEPASPKMSAPAAMAEIAGSKACGPQAPAPTPAQLPERMEKLQVEAAPAEPPRMEAPRPAKSEAAPAELTPDALRSRLGAAIPDFGREENGSRERRASADEGAVDLDAAAELPELKRERPTLGATEDFVAAARRAAQKAAARAEERSGGRMRQPSLDAARLGGRLSEPQPKRKSPVLIILAAVLLLLSAVLLYSRLRSKPESEVPPPATEQIVPAPSTSAPSSPEPPAPSESAPAQPPAAAAPAAPPTAAPQPEHSGESDAPATPSSLHATQPQVKSGEIDVPETPAGEAESDNAASAQEKQEGGVTVVAKQPRAIAKLEDGVMPEPASLTSGSEPGLPAGVTMMVEEPATEQQPKAQSVDAAPVKLPVPPAALGPLALREAAASGDARAEYIIGLRYADGKGIAADQAEAIRWLELAASAGLSPAQYRLGVLYERGQGIAKDLGQAKSWYERAATQGNIKAMHNLAVANSGRGDAEADYITAVKWYEQAAGHGLTDSQFNLAVLAEHGLGMPKNLAAAYQWFAIAANSGDAEAAKERDLLKPQLPQPALIAADQAVKNWKPLPAKAEANEVPSDPAWLADADSEDGNKALVSRAQTLLNKLGYDAGPPDGSLGDRTKDAIKSFERKNGLSETGDVSLPLVTKLERLTS